MSSNILNRATLAESTGGDDDFAKELFVDYVPRAHEIASILTSAFERQDCETIRKAAHEIKGSSLTLGLEGVGELSREIEYCGRSADLSRVECLLPQFKESITVAIKFLVEQGLFAG